MDKGKYILIEGGEGGGKSTQLEFLKTYLEKKGINPIVTKEPGGTEVSELIRGILLTKREEELTSQAELFLYLAARSQLMSKVVVPALREGKWVISDRGYPSTIAYQGGGNKTPFRLIDFLNDYVITFDNEVIYPDLSFIITVPVEKGLKKATQNGADRMESKGIDYHKEVLNGYKSCLMIKKLNPVEINYIEDDPEGMHKQIIKTLEERFRI